MKPSVAVLRLDDGVSASYVSKRRCRGARLCGDAAQIGIGGSLAATALPHHLACGSALGDSPQGSKLAPEVSEKHKSLI